MLIGYNCLVHLNKKDDYMQVDMTEVDILIGAIGRVTTFRHAQ